MRLDRYIARTRIIDLESEDLEGALAELVEVSSKRLKISLENAKLVRELLNREETMTTILGNGIAMPHMRVPMERPYLFAVGRCRDGIDYQDRKEYHDVRLIFLLLASEQEKNYLNVLASLARLFRQQELVDSLVAAPTLKEFRDRVTLGFGGLLARPAPQQDRFNRIFLREGERIAKASRSAAILLFADTFAGGINPGDLFHGFRTVLVTRGSSETVADEEVQIDSAIEVRSFSQRRLAQMRSAVIIGLTRGLFKPKDRLTCIGGVPGSNQLDTIIVVEVEREFQTLIASEGDLLPPGVKVEVVERVIGVATELAVEGREGKPIGALFVVGDYERVRTMIKPLVLNPFHGYREEDRNVLNPFMDETMKEFSVIDGCFVVRGDGVIETAGSLIQTPLEFFQEMPGGYGARHSAAAAISRAADCLAIVVSASTGQVTIMRRGVMVPLLEKPVGSS